MKKSFTIITLILVLILLASSFCFTLAHSGGTDSAGGHRDSSTGEYHYHHGYPAHSHSNGKCPYDYDDNTKHSYTNGSIFGDKFGIICTYLFMLLPMGFVIYLVLHLFLLVLDKFIISRFFEIPEDMFFYIAIGLTILLSIGIFVIEVIQTVK